MLAWASRSKTVELSRIWHTMTPIRCHCKVSHAHFRREVLCTHNTSALNGYVKSYYEMVSSLQWRHNGHDSVSDHRRLRCLLNRLVRWRSMNLWQQYNSPHKGPVTRKIFLFDDVIMWRGHTIVKLYDAGEPVYKLPRKWFRIANKILKI